ncbi:MAG: DUF4166 domain-containing protein [Hyphomicrobiaceae bacterium]
MTDLPLFHRAYGVGLARLPAPIRDLHASAGERRFEGRATVERGDTLLARATAVLLRFPPAGIDQHLSLRIRCVGRQEEWARQFDGRPMVTHLSAGSTPDSVVERRFPVSAQSRLHPDASGVTQTLIGLRFLGLPVPRALWPRLDVREGSTGDRYTFQMRIEDPWGRLVVAYRGWLEPAGGSAEQ